MSAVGHMVSVAYSASCCTVLHACFLSRDKPPYVPLKSNKLGIVRWLCYEGTLCQVVLSSVVPSSLVVLTSLALLRSKKPRSARYPELGKGCYLRADLNLSSFNKPLIIKIHDKQLPDSPFRLRANHPLIFFFPLQ